MTKPKTWEVKPKLEVGAVVLMKASSGLVGYGNRQCVSYYCEPLGTLGLYGHNVGYHDYDVQEIISSPASQVEKTRREAYEKGIMEVTLSSRGIHEIAAQKYEERGFKAGLQRAIELVPEEVHPSIMGWNNFRNIMLENLKKEMET